MYSPKYRFLLMGLFVFIFYNSRTVFLMFFNINLLVIRREISVNILYYSFPLIYRTTIMKQRRYRPKDPNQRCSQSCYCNSPKVILILINTTKRTETERENMTETKHGKKGNINGAKKKKKILIFYLSNE